MATMPASRMPRIGIQAATADDAVQQRVIGQRADERPRAGASDRQPEGLAARRGAMRGARCSARGALRPRGARQVRSPTAIRPGRRRTRDPAQRAGQADRATVAGRRLPLAWRCPVTHRAACVSRDPASWRYDLQLSGGTQVRGLGSGLAATSPGVGATARRVMSSASGWRPQTHTGSSGGQTQPRARAARNRLTAGPPASGRRSRPDGRRRRAAPRGRERLLQLGQLVVDGDAQRLEGARAGWPPANWAGTGPRVLMASTSCWVQANSCAGARGRCAGDLRRVALLAVLAQQTRQPPLVPGVDDLVRGQLLRRVHPHVQRRVIGVGEPARPGVDLHRRHPEVQVHMSASSRSWRSSCSA